MGSQHAPLALRRKLEGVVAAAVLGGTPSIAHAALTRGPRAAASYAVRATRAAGTLLGRPTLPRGVAAHLALSVACGELLARTTRTVPGAGGVALLVGLGNLVVVGRRFPAIRALPLGPQLADHVAFGAIFAVVANRAVGPRQWVP